MNDIVERLRRYHSGNYGEDIEILGEAADEIERLRSSLAHADEWRDENIRVWAEVERLKAALQQIAHDKTEIGYAKHIARAALEGK